MSIQSHFFLLLSGQGWVVTRLLADRLSHLTLLTVVIKSVVT